jgi:menaquinone-dependent protoporphyrinogen oxidase
MIMFSINRRKFIAAGSMAAAGVLGGAVLGSGKGNLAWAADPAAGPSSKRVLVAYDTSCGSTTGVAEAISQALANATTTVDLRLVDEAGDPGEYDAVVVGSAVRSERWLSDALDFVGDHEPELEDIPTAYFLTCMALHRNIPQTRKRALSFMEPTLEAAPSVKPVSLGLFAGTLDYSKFNPIMRMIVRSRMEDKGVPEGDFRDFRAIKAWADDLKFQLGLAGQKFGARGEPLITS